jgi:hypothetical protein
MTNETTTAPMAPSEEAQRAIPPEVMEKVIIGGDLSELNAAQRVEYYTAVCRSLELHPPTKPFEFLTLNGKLRLYALRDCTDQLRRLHGLTSTSPIESAWAIFTSSPPGPRIAPGGRMRVPEQSPWGT